MSQADTDQVVDLDKMERRALEVGTLRREGRLGLDANDALALIAELRQRRADSERLEELERIFVHFFSRGVDDDPDGPCRYCGLNIRDNIHERVDDPRAPKIKHQVHVPIYASDAARGRTR